ncbi:MAG: c-type cytochrome [Enterobacteriaceae bacterium]|nr:c-type cytochrome [Enterobacteriaceae bacterium]
MKNSVLSLSLIVLLAPLFYADSVNAQSTESAANLYQLACSDCHGKNGDKVALKKARLLVSLDEAQITEALIDRRSGKIKGAGNGVKKRLSDDDIKNLAAYIQTLKK